MPSNKKTFPRSVSALEKVFDFTGQFVKSQRIDDKVHFILDLAVEEYFTNMVRHNVSGKREIELRLKRQNQELQVTMVDPDSQYFDVTKERSLDLTKSLSERKVGGLGVYLVKKMVDSLRYEYSNRKSTITFVLHLE